jgi:DNA-binding transcriptional ArsR family regulator
MKHSFWDFVNGSQLYFKRSVMRFLGQPKPAPRPRRPHRSDSLTAQKVLDALAETPTFPATVAQLEAVVGTQTVQSALYALIRDGYVTRSREGRHYVYRLVPTREGAHVVATPAD